MSTLNVSNITDGTTTVGTSYVVNGAAKAWINFDGYNSTNTRDSFNMASTTDIATGRYQHFFTSNMNNTSYAITTNGHRAEDFALGSRTNEQQVNAYEVMSHNHTNTSDADSDSAFSVVHGDLA